MMASYFLFVTICRAFQLCARGFLLALRCLCDGSELMWPINKGSPFGQISQFSLFHNVNTDVRKILLLVIFLVIVKFCATICTITRLLSPPHQRRPLIDT